MTERRVLIPFISTEAISTKQAAARAGKSPGTIRYWCEKHAIGRKIGGEMHVSRVALEMFLEGNTEALAAYHAGDSGSPVVVAYWERCGLGGGPGLGPA
jgi:hypothetical protein